MGSGLLKKANLLNQQKGLAFSTFIQKYSKKVFSILTKQNNFYFTTYSNGFDGDSILASYSTLDFWNGLISEKNKVVNFTEEDNSLGKLLQFFSFEMKDQIKNVSVYFTDSKIILLCNGIISDQFIQDFVFLEWTENFDFTSINQSYIEKFTVNKYLIDYSTAIKEYSLSKNKPDLSVLLEQALVKEIHNRLCRYFNSPNCTVLTKESKDKVIIFSNNKLEDDLLLKHLILNLKEVIGKYSNNISITFENEANTFEEIKEFLKVE